VIIVSPKEISNQYNKGLTLQDIAELYKTPLTSVYRLMIDIGIKFRKVGRRSVYDLEQARSLINSGYTYRQVGEMLGVNYSGVYRRVNGKHYS
jgi:hypothetical protein